MTFTST